MKHFWFYHGDTGSLKIKCHCSPQLVLIDVTRCIQNTALSLETVVQQLPNKCCTTVERVSLKLFRLSSSVSSRLIISKTKSFEKITDYLFFLKVLLKQDVKLVDCERAREVKNSPLSGGVWTIKTTSYMWHARKRAHTKIFTELFERL